MHHELLILLQPWSVEAHAYYDAQRYEPNMPQFLTDSHVVLCKWRYKIAEYIQHLRMLLSDNPSIFLFSFLHAWVSLIDCEQG